MKIRTCAALLLAVGLPTAAFAVDFPEIEPNETKAQALANGAFVLAVGDSVSGTTTGTSTSAAGAASADTFLVKTTPAALGIYRHRMVITSATAGHAATIRGLSATAAGLGTADNVMQTTSSSTTPARMTQWYGFGKGEQHYYRVTGAAATTDAYTATLSTDVVTPATAAGTSESGLITISDATSATTTPYDNDMFLFDSNLNPIVGMDDPDSSGLVANLTPGTYYVAFGTYNTAAGRMAGAVVAPATGGIQGTWQTGSALDFDDMVVTSRTTSPGTIPTSISVTAINGTQTVTGTSIGWGDVQWFSFTVVPSVTPTSPTASDTATGPVVRDGVATSTLTVTVTPGTIPTSTGLAVVVDDSSVGGSGTLALADDGTGADATAGDNIFTGTTTVAYTTALGAATLPFTVTDDQARSFNGSLNFTVGEASGACCTDSGCIVTTIGDCLDVQGGTFAGTGTVCTVPTAFSTDGTSAFNDISATGVALDFGTDDDDGELLVTLPFTFNFFGADKVDVWVGTNGYISFDGFGDDFSNDAIPTAATPNDALYVLWDDMDLNDADSVFTQSFANSFIVQWNGVGQYNGAAGPVDASTFQVELFDDGSFEFRYQSVSVEAGSAGTGDTTTIGYENPTGTVAGVLAETRATLSALAPISYRANSTPNDTGVCGPSCPPCAADYDGNGGVDGGDLAAFFADFEAGETCADVDGNGGVDGGDLAFFFFVFEAGGCE